MNAFFDHHQDSIRLSYRCFDRLLLNGLIQPFQQPERFIGFFNAYREGKRVTRDLLHEIADQYKNWVTNRSHKWNAPILEAPEGRRDDFMDPYFRRAKPDEVVAILRAREPARILIANGNKKDDRWHLQLAQRWVIQYNFYINDARWGRMFVRVCPYFPFSARVCLNQHYWLANRMREERIHFQQCSNAFSMCSDPKRLQQLSDSLSARDLLTCGQKWLATCTPFFSEHERKQAGCQHRLFFAQVEYCDNLIFERHAALDALGERLLDANRTIKPAQQDHDHLRSQGHQALRRQTPNGDRGSRFAQSRHPQPLRQRVHQAIRARPSQPAHRHSHERCHRLRRQKSGRKSPPTPPEDGLHST